MTRLGWNILMAAVAVIALGLYGKEQRKRGAAEAQGERWKLELDSLAKVARRVDTVYQVKRDTFYVRRIRLDTLTLTVDRWKLDTVKVVEYVALADSTIRACTEALVTCEARVAIRDQQLRAWQRRWDARPKPPSALEKWGERILTLGIGYAAGRFAP